MRPAVAHAPFARAGFGRRWRPKGQRAGAAGATICGHGPSLLALTTDENRTKVIARAMVEAQKKVGRRSTPLVLQVAHYGALPMLQDAIR